MVAPACAVFLLAACAGSGAAIRVDDAWARPTGGSGPGVVYLSIHNDGDRPDRLVGARSPSCATIEIHQTQVSEGRMSMVPIEGGVALEPGATVELKPGGYHLMLFGPVEPLRVGMRIVVTLEFERNGEIPLEIEVRR